jgi:hypothetical protein
MPPCFSPGEQPLLLPASALPFPDERALHLLLAGYCDPRYHCCAVDAGVLAGVGGTGGEDMGKVIWGADTFFVVSVINYCCKYIIDLL